jgi:membrane fusion protein, multidrug efflux system
MNHNTDTLDAAARERPGSHQAKPGREGAATQAHDAGVREGAAPTMNGNGAASAHVSATTPDRGTATMQARGTAQARADLAATPGITELPPAEATRPTQRPRRNPLPLVIAALAAVTLGAWGVRQWAYARSHVSTDNAQIQGDVVPVLPRVSGFVAEVRVAENQPVHAGDILVVLDDRDLRAKLEQSEADLRAAEAEGHDGGGAVAQLAAARAAVGDAEAAAWKADADLRRFRSLAAQGLISAQDLDGSEATARGANARLEAARDRVHVAEAGLGSASAKEASARAARDQAALQLSYTRLLAPMSGIVSRKDVQIGQLVQVGEPLMSVVPINDVWVVANLKETDVQDVKVGETVQIRVDSYPGQTFRGTIESLSPASGARFSLLPPDNATGNFTKVVQRIPVRIRIDGNQDPRRLLRPGMSVTVVIATA